MATAMSEKDMDETAALTLGLLETRLRTIEYAIYGHLEGPANSSTQNQKSAAERLRDLESALDQLTTKSKVVQDLLKLRARHPDLFQNSDSTDVPSLLDTASKSAIVLCSAAAYPLTASSLTSILDTPIPEAELSAKIIATRPQLSDVAQLQASQMKVIASLKDRTAAILERWYSVDVLQSGEYWAEVEARVNATEQRMRRAELARHEADII